MLMTVVPVLRENELELCCEIGQDAKAARLRKRLPKIQSRWRGLPRRIRVIVTVGQVPLSASPEVVVDR